MADVSAGPTNAELAGVQRGDPNDVAMWIVSGKPRWWHEHPPDAPTCAWAGPERRLRPGTQAYLLDGLRRAQGPLVYATVEVTKEMAAGVDLDLLGYVRVRLERILERGAKGRQLGTVRLLRFDLDDEEEPPRRMLGFVAYAALRDRAERGEEAG